MTFYQNLCSLFFLFLFFLTACKNNPSIKKETKTDRHNIQKEISSINTANKDKRIADYIPEDYFLLDSTSSSSGIKGERFIVLVLGHDIENNTDSFSDNNRPCIILKENNGVLQQIARNDNLILCKNCGGVFGDPYEGVELKGNVLTISNYGGSAWRWSNVHTFRYENNSWNLIGATYDYYFNAKDCNGEVGAAGRQFEDINFASGKMQIIHTKDESCDPYESYWKKFEKKKPITFSSFPGQPEQWPNGKVQDGDGKD